MDLFRGIDFSRLYFSCVDFWLIFSKMLKIKLAARDFNNFEFREE